MKKDKPTSIPRQKMPEQNPTERINNFSEVPLGYSQEQAQKETQRCLQCKKAPCVKGCPVEVQIPDFIQAIKEGRFLESAAIIKQTNSLPAVCGRVCPQEEQCEKVCVIGKISEPVSIGKLERYAADYEQQFGSMEIPEIPEEKDETIAIAGSGPAGLTAAGDLRKMGYQVTIYEALHEPGGVLIYGIPEFRLPKKIVEREIEYLKKLGVKIKTNVLVGRTVTVKELLQTCKAVFISVGAGLPKFMGIPGENLAGIFSSNEYLTRSNLMKAYRFPHYNTPLPAFKRVAVIGGGNVALDSARTALRYGAEKVYLIYRRSRNEMPARQEEIHHAEEEGIEFSFLQNPVEYVGNEKGQVQKIRIQKMELGEPDDSGRRRPQPIPGSEYEINIDAVIVAIGTEPQKVILQTTPGLKLNKWGNIEIDPQTGMTSLPGVFAGGDIVTGAATVIEAMGAGKIAARGIDQYLRQNKPNE